MGIQIYGTNHMVKSGGWSESQNYKQALKIKDVWDKLEEKERQKRIRKHTTIPFVSKLATAPVKVTGIVFKKDNKYGDGICIGDLNRADSQNKRGGGYICFKNEHLSLALGKAFTDGSTWMNKWCEKKITYDKPMWDEKDYKPSKVKDKPSSLEI